MSKTIDERVVEMRFDNRQFEKNISTTMDSLDKLKSKLDLSGAAKGLTEVESASRKVDMSGLTSAVETVKTRFSALEVMAVTALANITNGAVNAGKRIISALTINPVTTGFSEYELKMGSIQTIMASTGESLETVNGYLNELNEYSDKTIYSFSDMTQNIGKFTNAGVSLKDSVAAIQGVSNVAALSGANANEASRAMYNFSQALSSGYVKLIDWKSIENANMATVEFKNQLLETAVAEGKLTKTSDGMYKTLKGTTISATKNFNDSLQEQWMTSEVLIGTLGKYTDTSTEIGQKATKAATEVKTLSQLYDTLKESAQSGWAQTWEMIVGDFEEAKEFMTYLSEVIGGVISKQAESRNELIENWKVLGGRTALLDSIKNVFEAIGSVVKPISEAFRDIFPPTTAEQLVGLTEGLKSFTEKLKLSDTTAENLKRTFKGVFAIFGIAKQVISAVLKAIGSLTGEVGGLGGGILGMTASIGDWLVKLHDTLETSQIFSKILGGIVDVIKAASKGLKAFIDFVKGKIVTPGFDILRFVLGDVRDQMSTIGDVAGVMKDGVIKAFEAIESFFSSSTIFKVMEGIWKGVMIFASGLMKAFSALTKGLAKIFGNADFNGIVAMINGLLTGGLLIKLMNFIDGVAEPLANLKEIGSSIKGILDGIRGCLESYQEKLKADALKSIAIAVGILAASALVLSMIDGAALTKALGAITTMFIELSVALGVIQKMGKIKGLVGTAMAMEGIAMAILILALAMKLLSSLSVSEMGVAFAGMAGGLAALVLAVNLLPEKKVNKAAKAMTKMATALLILSIALKIMGSMSWSEMAVGLTTMVVALAAMVGALYLLPKDVGLKTLGLVSFAIALVILAGALKIMATMSWGEMAIGLSALAGSLILIIAATKMMKSAIPGALAMLIIAPALLLLAASLKILGSLSWTEMGVALITLAGAMLILCVALIAMNYALPGAAALLIASAALAIFAPIIILLGSLSWQTVAQGLLVIAAAFAVVGIAGLLIAPIIQYVLAFAVAMALIGVGTLAAGAGLLAFSASLSALAVGFTTLVASIGAVVTGIVAIIDAVITGICTGIANGIVAFCKIIKDGAPAIFEALTAIIIGLCDAIVVATPSIIHAIDVLLTALLAFLLDFVPRLVDAGLKLVIGILDGIAANIGGVVEAGTDVILAFIKGLTSQTVRMVNEGMKLIVKLINGLADAIRNNTPKMIEASNNLMSAVFEAIGMFIGNAPQLGKNIIQGLIKGIKNSAGGLIDSLVNTVKNAWNSVLDFLGIASPSKLAAEAGRFIDEGMVVGLKNYADSVGDAAVDVGHNAMDSLKEAVGGISDIVDADTDFTIRPVLDLSNVRTGAAQLSGILGRDATIGVMTNIGAIDSAMVARGQNGGDVNGTNNSNVTNNTYIIDGVTYDDGSNIASAMEEIVHAAKVERRT